VLESYWLRRSDCNRFQEILRSRNHEIRLMGFESRASQNRFKITFLLSNREIDGICQLLFFFLMFFSHIIDHVFFTNRFKEPPVCDQIGGWEFKFFKT